MTHHPHIHMIVPGGGLSPDGSRWVTSRPAFLLPVRVLGKLFRRLFLTRLMALHEAGLLGFFGSLAHLVDRRAFLRHLSPVRKKNWVVYAKLPFAGPETVLAYLSRYTHRVAISNSRLLRFDQTGVTFRYKDYRRGGADRQQVMTLTTDEFIRRFLLHVLPPQPFQRCFASPEPWAAPPKGFHRIRHVACPGLDPGACSPAPPARRISDVPANCSASRHHRSMSRRRSNPMTHARHRNLRTPATTTCPAAWHQRDRDHHVMTGMAQLHPRPWRLRFRR